MAGKQPEAVIADDIIVFIKESGGDAHKQLGNAATTGGLPDIAADWYSEPLGRWLHLQLEVKTETGEPSDRQLFRLDLYKKRGYVAGIVRSREDVAALIAAYEKDILDKQGVIVDEVLANTDMAEELESVKQALASAEKAVEATDLLLEALQGQSLADSAKIKELEVRDARMRGLIDQFVRANDMKDIRVLAARVKKLGLDGAL